MLRLIIAALVLYATLFAPCRLTAAERPRQCPRPPQAPPVRACICGDACACPAGACPSRCPVVVVQPVQYQQQYFRDSRGRLFVQLVPVSGTTATASGCANGQCPLPRR